MYRIFRGKHLIILSSNAKHLVKFEPDFLYKRPTQKQIKEALRVSKKSRRPLTILMLGNAEKMLQQIVDEFQYVEAGGGIVENHKRKILLMKRLGKWDLPKGKSKKNENKQTCAMREVEEETGAQGLSIIEPFAETYHTYYRNRKWQLKHTFWYLMKCDEGKNLTPQIEEDIEEVRWVKHTKINITELNTYPAIKHLLNKYAKLRLREEKALLQAAKKKK